MGGFGSGGKTKKNFDLAPDREPYERQPGESGPAWEAFELYRELGHERSLRVVNRKLNKSLTIISRWSFQFGWRERVEAWDLEVDRVKRKAALKKVEQMHERHLEVARLLMDTGRLGIEELLKQVREAREKNETIGLSVTEIQKLLESAIKLERACMGEPESIIEQRQKLSVDDERESLRGLLSDPSILKDLDAVVARSNETKSE